MMLKKAQSQVISTVLLILLASVTIIVIFGFAIPFVKDNLSGGDCVKVVGKVNIENNLKFTCYNASSKKVRIQISIGDVAEFIEGFKVELGGASSNAVKLTEYDHAGVGMYEGGNFELPKDTEARTYVIGVSVKPEYIKVYSILKNGKTCDAPDVLVGADLEGC